jgi:hypothetical protein
MSIPLVVALDLLCRTTHFAISYLHQGWISIERIRNKKVGFWGLGWASRGKLDGGEIEGLVGMSNVEA